MFVIADKREDKWFGENVWKINLPQLDKYHILLFLRHLQQTQLNSRKKQPQPQETNCTWLLKGIWNICRSGWQFVGDGGRWYQGRYICVCMYVYINICNIYTSISFFGCFNCTLSTSVSTALINSNWWNGMDFTFPNTAVYSQFTQLYICWTISQYMHCDAKNLVHFIF